MHGLLEMSTIWANLINGETLPLSLNGSKISLTKITADLSNLKFDISEFYPLISEELLEKSISFAKNMTIIDNGTIQIIKHARKSLLIDNTSVWVKNDDNPLFDVTKGSFDSAEVCELVGLYLPSKISVHIDSSNVGLHRDDGLAVIHNVNGPKLDWEKT